MNCPATVHWYDCDLDVSCELERDHPGLHTDGVRWFDRAGMQRPTELEGRYSPTGSFTGATESEPATRNPR